MTDQVDQVDQEAVKKPPQKTKQEAKIEKNCNMLRQLHKFKLGMFSKKLKVGWDLFSGASCSAEGTGAQISLIAVSIFLNEQYIYILNT